MSILLVLLLGSFDVNYKSSHEDVVVKVLDKETLLIESDYTISNIFISNLYEKYSYFIEYSHDEKKALILLRTTKNPLNIVIECETLMGVKRGEVNVTNPCKNNRKKVYNMNLKYKQVENTAQQVFANIE